MHAQSYARNSDVIVIGGGFAGIATAAALAAAGLRVVVIEAKTRHSAFRGELIHPPGVRALSSLGFLEPLARAGAVRIEGFAVVAANHAGTILLPYAANSGGGIALDHAALVASLRSVVAEKPRVTFVWGKVDVLLRERGRVVGARITDGETWRAPLVVAADGRHSSVRKWLGIPTRCAIVSHSVALVLAGRLLREAEYGHVFVGAPGPILAYPYRDDCVRLCIDVPLGAANGSHGLRRYLHAKYVRWVPAPIQGAFADALERSPLSGSANHAVRTGACAVPGAALVGDAGGCSHPITATGMTTAMHDVTSLAACIASSGPSDDALIAYQRRRYRFVRAREAFTQSLHEVLLAASPGALALREGMFHYWRTSARARNASMAVLSGDDERLWPFLGEYARVVAASGSLVLMDRARDETTRAKAAKLRDLVLRASASLGGTVEAMASALALEATRALTSYEGGRHDAAFLAGRARSSRPEAKRPLDERSVEFGESREAQSQV